METRTALENDALLVSDPDCERAVLGTLMLNNSVYLQIEEILTEECFFDETCRQTWKACVEARKAGMEIDTVSIGQYFMKNKLTNLLPKVFKMTEYASLVNVLRHAQRLRDLTLRRKGWEIGMRLVSAGTSEVDDITTLISETKEKFDSVFSGRVNSVYTMTSTFQELNKTIEENQKIEGFTGTPTGFERLDKLGGLHGGWLVTIAAETAMGKTSFADTIVKSCIEYGHPVSFYSMEMTREELVARFLSMKTGIPAGVILYGNNLSTNDIQTIKIAEMEYNSDCLLFDDNSTSNVDNIVNSIYTMHARHGIKGAVVDYIQMLNVNMNATNKEALMGECSRKLKNAARDLKIWVIILSQFNRNDNQPVPTLDRLRDSGQIAEASDVVLLLYRPEVKNRQFPEPFTNVDPKGKALINVAKGRNIETGTFIVGWDGKRTAFYDLHENLDSLTYINEQVPPVMREEIAPF